jgi:hypothetical protein
MEAISFILGCECSTVAPVVKMRFSRSANPGHPFAISSPLRNTNQEFDTFLHLPWQSAEE